MKNLKFSALFDTDAVTYDDDYIYLRANLTTQRQITK
jgi:hypothetical protein